MDSLDVVALTRRLVDVESTTGQEAVVCAMVGETLEQRGYAVTRQTVTERRVNLLATVGTPEVILSTHMDCVPPFIPSRLEGDRIFGRGSCDAKGILVSQLAAVEALRAAGETRVGLLFLVGEERGSDGAMIADQLSAGLTRYLVNGEPTEARLALGHRGVVRVKLHARGKAAHSGYPHLGESAIEKLLDALQQVRAMSLPIDAVLGSTQVNIGAITGGLAPNVVPPSASASLHMATLEGFEKEVVGYTTDAPLLNAWGTRLMYGPGSIHVAHTDHESVAIADLDRAVDDYQHIARALLAS